MIIVSENLVTFLISRRIVLEYHFLFLTRPMICQSQGRSLVQFCLIVVLCRVETHREGPKGASQQVYKYTEDPADKPIIQPVPRRGVTRGPPTSDSYIRDSSLTRRTDGDDMAPLIAHPRQPRPGDVTGGSRTLPEYQRPTERDYPVAARKRSGPSESGGFDYYVGYAPEHEQASP